MSAVSTISILAVMFSMSVIMGMLCNSYHIGVMHIRALRHQNLLTHQEARPLVRNYTLRSTIAILFFISFSVWGPEANPSWATDFTNMLSLPHPLSTELANTFLILNELTGLLFGACLFRKFPVWCARFNRLTLPVHQMNALTN